eukprot:jgi/Botrbrau1/8170/Bobra.357_2s0016.1
MPDWSTALTGDTSPAWQAYTELMAPHPGDLPHPFEEMTPYQKLLVLACLRPDRFVAAARDLVSRTLGSEFNEPNHETWECACWIRHQPVPSFLILSPGFDTLSAVRHLAEERGMIHRFSSISLGQGHGAKAESLVRQAAGDGNWILLQNCHLAPTWMPVLHKIFDDLKEQDLHQDFRLFLATRPMRDFPFNILEEGITFSTEPQAGLKARLKAAFTGELLSSADFFKGSRQQTAFKRLAFGLAFFHAVVQERSDYGVIGWNHPYSFVESDLHLSLHCLRQVAIDSPEISYTGLRYIIGECYYGGQISDPNDRQLLSALLESTLNEDCAGRPSYPSSLLRPSSFPILDQLLRRCNT